MATTTEKTRRGQGWRASRLVVGLAVIAALAVGAAWLLFARTRDARRARAVEARAAVAERRLDEARGLIDRWASINPGDGEPYYLKAKVEVAAGRPEAALDAMREAAKRGYDPGQLNVLRAVLTARTGENAAAEPILRRALDSSKDPEPEVAEGLARIYLSSFRLSQAAAALERWMKDAPGDGRPYLWRNEIDQRIDADAAVVIRNYRMALQRDPSLDKARLGLADKLREQQRADEAEVEYDLYIKRNPKNVDGHVGAGQASLQKGDVAAAVRHFNDALAIDPKDAVALRELALIDLRNGRYTQARDRLKTVIEVDPYDPEVHSNYARALKMSGDAAKVLEENATTERLRKEHRRMNELRVKLVERPDDLALRNEAARWLLEHGHEAEGLEWTKLILSKQADHPETNALLAEYYRKRGNVGLANYYKMAAAKAGAIVP